MKQCIKILIKLILKSVIQFFVKIYFFFQLPHNYFKPEYRRRIRKSLINFKVDNYYELKRWDNLSKEKNEPDTLNWIDNFHKNSNFLDIGANIGIFSIYAFKKKCKVYAIEPEPNSFGRLLDNIVINKANIKVLNFAIFNKKKISNFNINNGELIAGESDHQLNTKISQSGKLFKPIISFGIYSCSLDSLVEDKIIKYPNYIKIDVDGVEEQVLFGSKKILKSKQIRSIMCEIVEKKRKKVINFMKKFNFKCKQTSKNNFLFTKD